MPGLTITLTYPLLLALFGAAILFAALVPPIVARYRLPRLMTLPIGCVLGGIAVGRFFDLPMLDVIDGGTVITHVTETVVLLSLTGCGLKIDRAPGWRSWGTTWRLLGLTMVLCIAAMTLLGWAVLGLPLAAALLLGEGHFHDKLTRSGAEIVTAPLGASPQIVEQILTRFDEE